jgi:flagellar protein FliL
MFLHAAVERGEMADKKPPVEDDKKTEGAPEGAEGAEGTNEAEGKAGGGKKKLIIILAVVLLLLVGGGAGAYFMGYLDAFLPGHKPDCEKIKEGEEGYEACAEEIAKKASDKLPGVFIDFPDLLVNLNTATRQPHFLKLSIKVELENKEAESAFLAVQPRVIDQFQTYLRELRMEDLRGSSGLYRMKIELLNRVKAAAPEIKVRDVLFQEILVQ